MFDYIMKDKEWIFSGMGVSLVGIVLLVFKYFWHKNHKIETITSTSTSPQTPTTNKNLEGDGSI